MAIKPRDFFDTGQRLFWLAVLVYIAFTVGTAINKNYQSHRQIRGLKDEIAALEQSNIQQELLNVYYQSETFKELEARRRLALKRPDENVFILPPRENASLADQAQTASARTSDQTEPNPRKWLKFLLGI